MLLERIQRDLFEFTAQEDPDDFGPLMNFWYRANSPALSAALTAHPGLKLIVDVPNVRLLDALSKKLLLMADTIVFRGLSSEHQATQYELRQLVPLDEYKPGYIDDVIQILKDLRPSPLTLSAPTPYWTSTKKNLRRGQEMAYAVQPGGGAHQEIVNWLSNNGRMLLESGQLAYAPFIPSIQMEQEFLKEGLDVSAYFGTSPCFHQNMDWIAKKQLDILLSLNFPYLDGLDLETLAKVKNDYRDEFENFSRMMLNSIEGVKGAIGSNQFSSEVRNIQRNMIDAGVSDVNRTFRKISAISSLRKKGMLVGLVGLNAAACFGAPELALTTGLAASGVKMVVDKIEELKEKNQLKELKHYFLWKVSATSKKGD